MEVLLQKYIKENLVFTWLYLKALLGGSSEKNDKSWFRGWDIYPTKIG